VPALICTVMAVGVDNVLFSVDWPYESNRLGTEFVESLPLSSTDKAKIAHGNAARVPRM